MTKKAAKKKRGTKGLQVSAAAAVPPSMAGYAELLNDIKSRIQASQLRAMTAANRELIHLYWDIGRTIVQRQHEQGWGKSVVDQLAGDLQREFPGRSGFSAQNLWYMRQFYLAWTSANLQQAVGEFVHHETPPAAVSQLPWGHNLQLLAKLDAPEERLWYAQQSTEHGWSRAVLTHQLESRLYHRQGKAITNFRQTLPAAQSELAQQLLKDPYTFDFLGLGPDVLEQDIERGLLAQLEKFLVELGAGFAFVGRQYHLEVAGDDFYLDLLFYHLRLRCFVVFDLKIEAFRPEFAGKMNFYLTAIDEQLRDQHDRPSIGVILCKEGNRLVVEYALRDTSKPMGVASYRLSAQLPAALQQAFPPAESLLGALSGAVEVNFTATGTLTDASAGPSKQRPQRRKTPKKQATRKESP
jgi:predicted nuclease of restriction endonuclease-like (RecB) superfamily